MSWIEKVNTEMTITTGDGKTYTPSWMEANANKAKEFNTAQFEFNEVNGSLVKRTTPKGRVYNIEIRFVGDDCLDMGDEFDESSDNPAPWGIYHPIYGSIIVQPISLQWDNSVLNVTRIIGTIVETISDEAVKIVVSAPDKIEQDKILTDNAHAETFATDIPKKKISVLNQVQNNVNSTFAIISQKISDTTDITEFTNKYNEVNSLINQTIYNAGALIGQVQELITMPARFAATIAARFDMFKAQFAHINAQANGLKNRQNKKVYEAVGGSIITSVVLSAVTNTGTAYINRNDILIAISTISNMFTTHIGTLNVLQTNNGGSPDSYLPDPDAIISLNNLVNYAISSLFEIAKDSRQERVIILEEDSNLIMLAERFYGLQPDDSTITEFKESNNIGLNEMLQIKKGRRLVYYK